MQWLPAFARAVLSHAPLREDAPVGDPTEHVDMKRPAGTGEPAGPSGSSAPPQEPNGEDGAGPESGASADPSRAPDRERRSEPRQTAAFMGRLRLPASEQDCGIVDLSTSGMSIVTEDAVVSVGEQVAVVTQDFPRLIGIVQWTADGIIGIKFMSPLAPGIIEKVGEIRRRVRGPRAGRAKLELASVVYFDGAQHDVIVGNISVGGLLMTTCLPVLRGQRKLIRDGQALMIQLPELLPIGGHVRWTCGAQCGVAFSKLLPMPFAEEIARLGNLNAAWLDDVRLAHADFEED